MTEAREQEVITTIQEIQKRFSAQNFENKFVSTIKDYLNNSEDMGYYDMRSQLDFDFKVDMNPVIMYIINAQSISDSDVDTYIKVIDNVKSEYSTILHRKHQAAINPLFMAQ